MGDYENAASKHFLNTLHLTSEGRLDREMLMVDPVTWHIFESRQDLMTDEERAAAHYLAMLDYARCFTTKRDRIVGENRAKRLLQPAIDALLADGPNVFLESVAARILQQHGDKILNRCPKCAALARTPKSSQCWQCFYSWRASEAPD